MPSARRRSLHNRGKSDGIGNGAEANMSLAIDGELCAKAHDGNPGNAVNPTANTLKDGGHH